MYKKHPLLGQKDVAKWGVAEKTIQGEQCPRHVGNVIQMFCGDHDVVGCTVCVFLEHRSCKLVDHIPSFTKGILQSLAFRSIPSKLTSSLCKLNEKKSQKTQVREALLDTCKDHVQSIKDLRNRVDQHMARLERKTIELSDELRSTFAVILEADENDIDKAERNAQQLMDDYRDKAHKSENAGFICMKNCEQFLVEVDRMIGTMTDEPYEISFTPALDIEKHLASLERLGQFQTSSTQHTPTQQNIQPEDMLPQKSSTHHQTKKNKIYIAKEVHKYKLTTSIKTDSGAVCSFWGLCSLPNGRILAADHNNKRVQQLNEKFSAISHIDLPSQPTDICHQGDNQAVVCTRNRDIYFLDARSVQMKLNRTVKLDHSCTGIAHYNGQLYLAANTNLYLYSTDCKLVKKLYEDNTGGMTVCHVAISGESSRVYITDYEKHRLVTLDNQGKHLATSTDPELQRPSGLCVSENGDVLVCGQTSNTVLQVSSDGNNKLAIVASMTNGVDYPRCVMFGRRSSQLLVGQWDAFKNLLVIKLKYS